MSQEQTYPADPMDHKRPEFESGIERVAVERFAHTKSDATLNTLLERNRNGRYAVEWVRGAWEGFCMAQPQQLESAEENRS